jgi:hypothetical protein
MKNIRLSFTLLAGILSVMLLNSCSSSRNFEGYYPEQRISGKGYGNANVEQPSNQQNDVNAEEVIVLEETTAPTNEELNTTDAPVVTTTPTTTNPINFSGMELTPREQKWVNKLGLNKEVDPNATPKKMNFMERAIVKMFSKMAQRQMNKHFDGAGVQGMDIADIFAIVSLSAGGAAFLWYAGFLFGPAAIVFGVLALKRGTSRRGMAIAGICLGAFALLLWILYIALVVTVVAAV